MNPGFDFSSMTNLCGLDCWLLREGWSQDSGTQWHVVICAFLVKGRRFRVFLMLLRWQLDISAWFCRTSNVLGVKRSSSGSSHP